jgi:hypothetical protein
MRTTSFLIPIALTLAALALPGAAAADDFHVDSLFDDGVGSLRAAIAFANQTPGPDRIVFHGDLAGKTLWIETPAPVISEAVEVIGPAGGAATVRSTGNDRVLSVVTDWGAIVVLRDLVLADGGLLNQSGGCLSIQGASVLLDRVRVTGCKAAHGGAISAQLGTILELQDSRVDHNRAIWSGGGIRTDGALFVGRSEIDHNTVDGFGRGGGIAFWPFADTQSLLWILDSHLHHNAATSSDPAGTSLGGALDAGNGRLLVERSSFYANRARHGAALSRSGNIDLPMNARLVNSTFAGNVGDDVVSIAQGEVALEYSTISANVRDGGEGVARAFDSPATVAVRIAGSVVSGNYPGQDGIDLASGERRIDADYSLIGVAGLGSVDAANPGTNRFGIVDPRLHALGWNGGPTPTMLPMADSPLIDAGGDAGLPATDQRGAARQVGTAADIGAVEDDGDRLFADAFDGAPAGG